MHSSKCRRKNHFAFILPRLDQYRRDVEACGNVKSKTKAFVTNPRFYLPIGDVSIARKILAPHDLIRAGISFVVRTRADHRAARCFKSLLLLPVRVLAANSFLLLIISISHNLSNSTVINIIGASRWRTVFSSTHVRCRIGRERACPVLIHSPCRHPGIINAGLTTSRTISSAINSRRETRSQYPSLLPSLSASIQT